MRQVIFLWPLMSLLEFWVYGSKILVSHIHRGLLGPQLEAPLPFCVMRGSQEGRVPDASMFTSSSLTLPLRLPQFSQWLLSAFVCLALSARGVFTFTFPWGVRPIMGSDTSSVGFEFLGGARKSTGLWLFLALPQISCLILGKSHHLFGPQFAHLYYKGIVPSCPAGPVPPPVCGVWECLGCQGDWGCLAVSRGPTG